MRAVLHLMIPGQPTVIQDMGSVIPDREVIQKLLDWEKFHDMSDFVKSMKRYKCPDEDFRIIFSTIEDSVPGRGNNEEAAKIWKSMMDVDAYIVGRAIFVLGDTEYMKALDEACGYKKVK